MNFLLIHRCYIGIMKRQLRFICGMLAAVFVVAQAAWMQPAAAEALTGKQIMERQKKLQKPGTEYAEEVMLLVDGKSGTKEKRYVKRYIKDMGGDLNRYLLVFSQPADIKGTSLLTHETEDEDNQWMYMPAVKKMQRIAQNSKKSYFMGTDFTYEDLEPEDIDNFTYVLIKEETLDDPMPGTPCYVIEALPANAAKKRASSYSRRVLWIAKDIFVTIKTEFYDRKKRVVKTQRSFEYEHIQGTIHRPQKIVMDNHKKNHKTLSLVKHRQINLPIDNSVFTERFILSGKHIE